MREALKRLQQAGLVAISQGGATRVRDWRHHGGLELLLEGEVPESLNAARAAMEMRACIGADAARRCAQRADAAQGADRRPRRAARRRRGSRRAQRALRGPVGPDRRRRRQHRLPARADDAGRARRTSRRSTADAVARELERRRSAIRALARAIADGEDEHGARARPRPARTVDLRNGRGPLLRDPVLRPAADRRVRVVPAPQGRRRGPRRLRPQGHRHVALHGHRQRDHQRRVEARRGRDLRRAVRADAAAARSRTTR